MVRGLWRRAGAIATSMALLVTAPAIAAPLSASARAAALTAMEKAIRKTYVFRDRIPAILAALDRSARDGRYDGVDANTFARRVSDDLNTVSHDGHLYLDNDRDHYQAALAPEKSAAGIEAYQRKLAADDNSGLVTTSILPGNVRYLRISAFQWVPRESPAAYDAALHFLKGGDAIIIDLRDNGGGDGDAADYLLDAILRPGTLLYTRHEGLRIAQSRTRRSTFGVSLQGRSIFVLVSSHTGSAAEAFSYALQQEKAATIVGTRTYGAANNNKIIPIPPQFTLSVSFARPINAITGTNWEGVGVKPDIAVAATDALATAQIAALNRLSSLATSAQSRENYQWAKIKLQSQLHPVELPKARLYAFAGKYGMVNVSYVGDELRLTRVDRPKWPTNIALRPLTDDGLFEADAFAFDDMRVRLTGTTLELFYGSNDQNEMFIRSH